MSPINLFKKEIAKCNLCDRKIYKGDYYGFEHDKSSLSISGYFDYYFCKKCVQDNCIFGPGEISAGQSYIITRRSGDRSRITIMH